MKNKLPLELKRISLTITIDPKVYNKIKLIHNKSRYIEKLIELDINNISHEL